MTAESHRICALCKIFSSGDLLYVRESEALICDDRHLCDDGCSIKDDGESVNFDSHQLHGKNKATKSRRSRSEFTLPNKDKHENKQTFGGDGDKNTCLVKNSATRDNLNNELELKNARNDISIPSSKLNAETVTTKRDFESGFQENDNFETQLVYRNMNYRESSTCLSASAFVHDKSSEKCFIFDKTTECKDDAIVTQRPIKCPTTECCKMLMLNSIFSHFHFDHSNTPIMNLDGSIKLTVKFSKFTSQNSCLAVLLPPPATTSRDCTVGTTAPSDKKMCPLLLMGVRLMHPFYDVKSESNLKNDKIFYEKSKINREKCESEKNFEIHPNISNYALLLWLCKFGKDETVYMITVTSECNKFSKNCIGPAFDLRHGDVPALYLAESLVIQGAAVNLLCDKQDHVVVVVQNLDSLHYDT